MAIVRVHSCLIPDKRLLANVDGVKNAVVVASDAAGPTLYYGAGAGSFITNTFANVSVTGVLLSGTAAPYTRFLRFGGAGISTNRDRFVVLSLIEYSITSSLSFKFFI